MPKRNNVFMVIAKEYWPFLLPLLLLLPGLSSFPYPGSGAAYSDFAITHYPNALFLKEALHDGTLPLWSPQILSGFPFIAHPYSGIWYPFYWLALLLPLPLGLNVLVLLHLMWAGIGVYKLLRQGGLGRPAAIFGGLAFEMAPTMFVHLGAGHLMLLLAVCWTPWLLWASGRHAVKARGRRLAQPGLVLALIFCADPRWAIYSGGLWLAWELALGQPLSLLERLVRVVKQAILAIALSAPALWLYAEYASLSTRAAIRVSEVLAFSLPPAALLGFVIPQPGAFHEWVLYPSVIVLILAIANRFSQKHSHERFWLIVLVATLLLSLGANIPGMQFIAGLPGFSQLRVPPRALLLAALALSILAARGLESLLTSKPPIKCLRLTLAALLSLCLVLAAVTVSLNIDLWLSCLWAATLLATFAILFELYIRKKLPVFAFALMALLLFDLAAMDVRLVRFRPAQDVIAEDKDVAAFLAAQPGRFRVFSPSYSLAQQTAASFDLQLADGVDPLQLANYADFMQAASGVPAAGYSISLPPFEGDPSAANSAYTPDPEKLELLNVEYVVSEFPIEVSGLDEIKHIGETLIYRNEFVRPRAWVEDAEGGWQSVDEIDWNYNRIRVQAEGPGLLVLSEIAYPGWHVRVDGQRVEMQIYDNLLRSVQLSAGDHEVIFIFEPLALRVALPLSLIALISVLLWPSPKGKKRKA